MAFEASMLQPLPHRAILVRLVRNLHSRYLRGQAWNEAFWTATHLVLLNPEDPAAFRDRAFIRLRRGEVIEALQDLQEAMRLSPESEAQIAEWMERMKKG